MKPPVRYNFTKAMRLTRPSEFDRVFDARRRTKLKGLTVLTAEGSPAMGPRLGISIGRSFGTAPARNRMKRRLREAFRLTRPELPALDFVCVPKPPALDYSVQELRDIFRKVAGCGANSEKSG